MNLCGPPRQVRINLINLLAKATGGHRCVATMATLQRLCSRLQAFEESQCNGLISHEDDTAHTGSSCLLGAGNRLVDQEIFDALEVHASVMLWGAAKFYDYINHAILELECNHHGYGNVKFANTLIVHTAPTL